MDEWNETMVNKNAKGSVLLQFLVDKNISGELFVLDQVPGQAVIVPPNWDHCIQMVKHLICNFFKTHR